jgi:hypothetical protein
VPFRQMFRHPILGRPAETALLWKWEALLTMDRRRSWERRENDRKGVLLLGTSTRARARIRAVRLISTEPLHRRHRADQPKRLIGWNQKVRGQALGLNALQSRTSSHRRTEGT